MSAADRFSRVIIADWSSAASPSPLRASADAIWLGSHDGRETTAYFRTRHAAEAALREAILSRPKGCRLLIGFDFPMAYPMGFAARLTGRASPRAVWDWLSQNLSDAADNRNNRFQIAAAINRRFALPGPFWGRPNSLALPDLPTTKPSDYPGLGLPERRHVETLVPRAQPVWKLYTTGAAGAQGLVGQPMIHRLSQLPGVAVWPFDPPEAPVVLAEVYPSLLARAVAADPAPIKDQTQVRLLSRALFSLSRQGLLAPLLHPPTIAREEGWILGAGHSAALEAALT